MASPSGVRRDWVDRPAVIALLIVLVGVRFVAATITAFAGIQGIDTRPVDAGFELYTDVLILFLAVVVGFLLLGWRPPLGREMGFLVFAGAAAVVILLWLGTVEPGARVLSGSLGPWSDFLLGLAAALALAALASVLIRRLGTSGVPRTAVEGLRLLAFGFATALMLRSIRLLDFAYLFGWPPPPGLLWFLDFGPSLLLAVLAIVAWAQYGVLRAPAMRDRLRLWIGPAAFAAVALAAALGALGGFIASNALAWGGSYTVFAPTTVSLPFVGLGAGAFVSLAWVVGRKLPRSAAWLVFGGIAIAALTGIQTSAGTLATLVGLLAGIVTAARGLSAYLPSHIE